MLLLLILEGVRDDLVGFRRGLQIGDVGGGNVLVGCLLMIQSVRVVLVVGNKVVDLEEGVTTSRGDQASHHVTMVNDHLSRGA